MPLTGCLLNTPNGESITPDLVMEEDWEYLCKQAEILQSILREPDHDKSAYTLMYIFASHTHLLSKSNTSKAFIRILGRTEPARLNHHFFQQFAKTAGGFHWDCPAVRALLPDTLSHAQMPRHE
jgi:hypothetical protein